jgi:hypothetical protein
MDGILGFVLAPWMMWALLSIVGSTGYEALKKYIGLNPETNLAEEEETTGKIMQVRQKQAMQELAGEERLSRHAESYGQIHPGTAMALMSLLGGGNETQLSPISMGTDEGRMPGTEELQMGGAIGQGPEQMQLALESLMESGALNPRPKGGPMSRAFQLG